MNEAIKLAIEKGGYKLQYDRPAEMCWLDPFFWQALGKALGWRNRHPNGDMCVLNKHDVTGVSRPGHVYHWHRFIDCLAEGKNIDEFFKELIK